MYFLLDTLPEETKQSCLEKLRSKPGVLEIQGRMLDLSTIRKLTDFGHKILRTKENKLQDRQTSCQMDYLDDIDIASLKKSPLINVCVFAF